MTTEWLPRNCFLSSRHRFPRHLQCPTFRDILASIDSKKLRTQMHLPKDAGVQLHAMLPGKIMRNHEDIMKYTSLDPWTSEIVAICCNDITMTHLAYVNVSSWSFWILFDSLCVFVASSFSPLKIIKTQGPLQKTCTALEQAAVVNLLSGCSSIIAKGSKATSPWTGISCAKSLLDPLNKQSFSSLSFLNQDQLTSMRSPCIVCTWWTQ